MSATFRHGQNAPGGPAGPPDAVNHPDTPTDASPDVFWFDITSLPCCFPERNSGQDDKLQFLRTFGSLIHPFIADSLGRLLEPLVLMIRYADGPVAVCIQELRSDPSLISRFYRVKMPADAVAICLGETEATVVEAQRDHEVTLFYSGILRGVLAVSVQ